MYFFIVLLVYCTFKALWSARVVSKYHFLCCLIGRLNLELDLVTKLSFGETFHNVTLQLL